MMVLRKSRIYAALVSRECETDETSETVFCINYLLASILMKTRETK